MCVGAAVRDGDAQLRGVADDASTWTVATRARLQLDSSNFAVVSSYYFEDFLTNYSIVADLPLCLMAIRNVDFHVSTFSVFDQYLRVLCLGEVSVLLH